MVIRNAQPLAIGETAILLWAAGADIDLPQFSGSNSERLLYLLGVDEQRVLHLINVHNLAARFAARAARERPGWCSRGLLQGVFKLRNEACDRFAQHTRFLRDIALGNRSSGCPPVVLKGCSTIALTADSANLRFSVDIDLLAHDPGELESCLIACGFTASRHDASEHEFSSLRCGGLNVEIHRYFPIWSYPLAVSRANLAPRRHRGVWLQSFPNRVQTEIRYHDVLARSTVGTTCDTAPIRVGDPAMCVLILCAHEFRNYLEPSARRPVAVQLGVLASIRDITRLPDFDWTAFRSLVHLLHGEDSLAFVGALLATYFADTRLLVSNARSRQHRRGVQRITRQLPFPRLLTFFGTWACLNTFEDALLPFPQMASHNALGGNHVVAARGPGAPRYSTGSHEACLTVRRIVMKGRGRLPIPLVFWFTWTRSELGVYVKLEAGTAGPHVYCVDIRADAVKWQGTQDGEWELNDGTGTITASAAETLFSVKLPWKLLARRSPGDTPPELTALTITVARYPRSVATSWVELISGVDEAVVVPVLVSRSL
jgi:hypothetical protein